jgi:hypothetical protein
MGKQMAYFDGYTEWPEQLGKVIGDVFSALMIIAVVALVFTNVVRWG